MLGRANTTAHSEWSSSPDKSFVSTKVFNAELYTYTASRSSDLSVVGTLVVNSSATANLCPAGRVLHANGRKLIPGVNPMTVFTGGSTVTVSTFMLGVYDPVSMLNGFIDPTSSTFAVYDKNRPASDYVGGANAALSYSGQGAKLLTANNFAALTPTAGGIASVAVAAANARAGVITVDAVATTVTVSSTAVTANSLILLSVVDAAGGAGTFAILTGAPTAGQFVFATNAVAKSIQFVVIN